jgi:hypothetical protein
VDAFVLHGCLIVDLTNGGTTFEDVATFLAMWKMVEKCFQLV